jgi:L-alanine-DL-glutamate epimerase-like enolase superfamily enzyme
MGYETALLSLKSSDPYSLFPSLFTDTKESIPINGLVWMGTFDFMKAQIDSLLEREFNCIKIKIGAIDFEEELRLLAQLRNRYDANTITIRVDANGAFKPQEALKKLDQLSKYQIHSIEQPIAVNQWELMSTLCQKSSIPIALDEELIGVFDAETQSSMLSQIQPQYLIFKPSLLGGFSNTQSWIDLADTYSIKWWVTSALESNIGLNAIAQWTYSKKVSLPQGLGTGSLFLNNIDSSLVIKKGCLWNDKSIPWKEIF